MPRILRIINRLNLGGPTYNVAYLTKFLAPEYETMLLAGMRDETEASSEFILEKFGITPVYISDMRRSIDPLQDLRAYQKIKTIIQQFKPDIVHTHAAKSGALGRLAAHHCKVPVIVHTFHGHVFHSYFNPVKTRIFIEIERYLAGISSGIITISNLQKKEIAEDFKICSPEKLTVIPLGFELDRFQEDYDKKRETFRARYQVAPDEIAIGIIGRLVPVKNHPLFLQALKQVLEKTSKKIKAFIVGDGEEMKCLNQLATDLGIPYDLPGVNFKNPLIFTSWLTNIDEVMAGLDIVAMTSFNEGTPVSLIEAQASNKAIVSTRVGGIEDVVVPGKTALLSHNNEAEPFAEHLLLLIEDDELRRTFGQQGYEFVREKFSFKRLVRDTDQYYRRLLNS